MYVVGGTFSAGAPARVDSTVDLRGGFVVPPFGDAHAHHFESRGMIGRINDLYLRDGIFYGMSPGAQRTRWRLAHAFRLRILA